MLEMCALNPDMLCLPILLNSDAASLRRRGSMWPIYAAFPFLPASMQNLSCCMPHVGMIPCLRFKLGRWPGMSCKTRAKKAFAARKRQLVQQCLAHVARAVNSQAPGGLLMRVQGKYQRVLPRVTTVSCDHAENTDINGCKSLVCPRCLDIVGCKQGKVDLRDLHDWNK
jgi:hypothetical protein